tara:strand:+ start:165 stop:524 length:360 start_codon:yes stop_codon:yes gene_type:complete
MYDDNNIFAKIIRKEIPCDIIYEDDKVLFFNDINPQSKIHVLGIPKDKVKNMREFISHSDQKKFKYFFDKVLDVIKILKLEKEGYRLITNDGLNANQEVPHFHVHILGGENLGSLMNIN